jgi:hypothetical protein
MCKGALAVNVIMCKSALAVNVIRIYRRRRRIRNNTKWFMCKIALAVNVIMCKSALDVKRYERSIKGGN